jgi:hypothetical protein
MKGESKEEDTEKEDKNNRKRCEGKIGKGTEKKEKEKYVSRD